MTRLTKLPGYPQTFLVITLGPPCFPTVVVFVADLFLAFSHACTLLTSPLAVVVGSSLASSSAVSFSLSVSSPLDVAAAAADFHSAQFAGSFGCLYDSSLHWHSPSLGYLLSLLVLGLLFRSLRPLALLFVSVSNQ